ncbi:hypothetical protein [Streptomyces sp. RKAG337]|uniref:hypothetical protein n=1 Tax=Streptomyces sp. RKAG337 TaxID=2893404 RepID=UPI002033DF25|nr:hypothetical protein [Streptomyces sp. RKAG337]MCM2424300.1 hypothetical protein [Streptomyces sp. RKAG337]
MAAAAGDGAIPRVDEVDPHDIGVSRSKYSDLRDGAPYVSAPQDDQLDAYLAEERFVVLAGRSKAGSPAPCTRRCCGRCPAPG